MKGCFMNNNLINYSDAFKKMANDILVFYRANKKMRFLGRKALNYLLKTIQRRLNIVIREILLLVLQMIDLRMEYFMKKINLVDYVIIGMK